jgi:hypothetical protein
MILAAGLIAAKAVAQETLPITIESGTVTYTIASAYLASHFENIEPAEGTEYLIIRLTAKFFAKSSQSRWDVRQELCR